MTEINSPHRFRIGKKTAIVVILFLWIAYTALQTLSVTGHIPERWSVLLAFLPGILGVAGLISAGFNWQDCFLVLKPLSKKGFVVLAAVFVFALAAILPIGVWQGWNWKAALVLAPAGGFAQELYFRSALLPTMLFVFKKRERTGLIMHSALFGLWHIGPLFVGAPLWAVAAVLLVPFLSGLGWGWQVNHDKTVVWAMIQHILIWVIGLQFPVVG